MQPGLRLSLIFSSLFCEYTTMTFSSVNPGVCSPSQHKTSPQNKPSGWCGTSTSLPSKPTTAGGWCGTPTSFPGQSTGVQPQIKNLSGNQVKQISSDDSQSGTRKSPASLFAAKDLAESQVRQSNPSSLLSSISDTGGQLWNKSSQNVTTLP